MKNIIILTFLIFSFHSFSAIENGKVISSKQFNNESFQIGDIKTSILTVENFQAIHGNCWKLLDGSSITGSDLANETGMINLPDMTTEGTFLRQAKENREIGSYEADENKSHTHSYETSRARDQSGRSNAYIGYGQNSSRSDRSGKIYATGGDENRPKNIAMNFFTKVNKTCQ